MCTEVHKVQASRRVPLHCQILGWNEEKESFIEQENVWKLEYNSLYKKYEYIYSTLPALFN